jgi:C-terminal processing protease CtpA/Prc
MSLFLNKGDTITTTSRIDGTVTVHTAKAVKYSDAYASCSITEAEIGKYRGYPMAVLTNGYTVSAAELFTIVMKDYGLAAIVGEKTFGKGVYQNIFGLSKWGYTGGLRLTVGTYDPPITQNFDGVGIEPTHPVTLSEAAAAKNFYLLTEAEDNQLQAAITAIKPQ